MKLVTYRNASGRPALGAVIEGGIVDLAAVAPNLPRDMLSLIEAGESVLDTARRAVACGVPVALGELRLMTPLLRPPEYIGVGLNYRDHLAEAGVSMPAFPTVFNKQVSCIVGPHDDVVLPRCSDQLDYEGELALVIGKAARNLSPEDAGRAIFGYLVANDLSVRDWQFRSPTVTLGKSFDTHGPLGPWITTADEVPDPQNLLITTTVNGQVRQRGSTADMIFCCRNIVAFLSQVMTLQPGTVITTGTPAGVGLFHEPPAFLRVGDEVIVNIAGLGRIVNKVIADEEDRTP